VQAQGPRPATAPATTAQSVSPPEPKYAWERSRRGFAVTNTGTVMAALHVVEGGDRIDVQCGVLPPLRARVASMSLGNDVAVLQPWRR
jgi:hypothetical protein